MITYLRYLFILFSLLSKPVSAAWWMFQILAPASVNNVAATYSGVASKSITVKISGFTPNTLNIVWSDCTNQHPVGMYEVTIKEHWIFIPSNISINGKSYPIKIESSPSGYVLQAQKVNEHYVFYKKGNALMSWLYNVECKSSGSVSDSEAIFPQFSFSINITGLENKNYTGTIPMKFLQVKSFSLSQINELRLTAAEAFSKASSAVNVNYSFNILNKCSVSTEQLQLNHGKLSLNNADGNTVSQQFNVSCMDPASVSATLSLESITKPNASVTTNGVLVGLGNGWNSILTVDGFDFSKSTSQKFTINSKKDLVLKSKLYKTKDSKVGALSGSALMKVSYD